MAYEEGATVASDPAQAVRWCQQAATQVDRGAQAKLGVQLALRNCGARIGADF